MKINFVKDRNTIVDVMEKIYNLGKQGKIDLIKVMFITDVLNWVVEEDDDFLEQLIKDCEASDGNN